MINGNIIIAFVIQQYLFFFLSLLNNSKKTEIINNNERIETLRSKRILNLEEQKEFVILKEGHLSRHTHQPFWKSIIYVLPRLSIVIGLLLCLEWLSFNPPFFITLIVSILLGIIINKIMSKFGLQRQDGFDTIFK
jgi:hypothetical protein